MKLSLAYFQLHGPDNDGDFRIVMCDDIGYIMKEEVTSLIDYLKLNKLEDEDGPTLQSDTQ